MARDLYCCRFGRFPRVALIATLKLPTRLRQARRQDLAAGGPKTRRGAF